MQMLTHDNIQVLYLPSASSTCKMDIGKCYYAFGYINGFAACKGTTFSNKERDIVDNDMLQRFDRLEDNINKKFDAVDKKFDRLEDNMNKKFDAVDKRFDAVDKKFENVDNRINSIDNRLVAVETSVEHIKQDVKDIKENIKELPVISQNVKELKSKARWWKQYLLLPIIVGIIVGAITIIINSKVN